MTNREYHEAIIRANISDEITAYARDEIAKLDKRNENRKNTPSKTAQANEPIKASIVNYLSEHEGRHLANAIANALGLTTAKASALCGQLVKANLIHEDKVKVAKVGIRSAYSAIPAENKAE